MATQQDVIKTFMQKLKQYGTSGSKNSALDDAIRSSSHGKYTGLQDAVNHFVQDCTKYAYGKTMSEQKAFLAKYCGIVMDNSDTGAITGADAGGTVIKNKDSIVPENASILKATYPATSTTKIGGITFHWPSSAGLSSAAKTVIARLNGGWLAGAINLVQNSYGMNFANTKCHDITVK